jgi:hypothetical protein
MLNINMFLNVIFFTSLQGGQSQDRTKLRQKQPRILFRQIQHRNKRRNNRNKYQSREANVEIKVENNFV